MPTLRSKLSSLIFLGYFLIAQLASADSTVTPTAYFGQSQITVSQSSGEVRIPVQVSGPPLSDFFGTRVNFVSVEGTATYPRDYDTPFPGSLKFNAGQNSQILVVGVKTAPAFLGTRTFTVRLSNPSDFIVGSPSTITVEIIGSIIPAPEIEVVAEVDESFATGIANNGTKNFGSLAVGSNSALTFKIKNTGSANLTGLGITKSGSHQGDFTITSSPVSPVTGPTGTTSFSVRFAPSAAGTRTAAIHIANNDSDENPFNINLTGTGGIAAAITAHPASVNIAYGGTAALTVTASGTGPLSYQWYQGATGVTTTPVGTNTSSLTTPALTATTSYWVRVTNPFNLAGVNSNTSTVSPNRFTLTTSAVNGSVTGAGIYDSMSTAVLTATPDSGYIFTGWTAFATGTTNPLNLVMNFDKHVVALFTQDLGDVDMDGLSHFEEVNVYRTNPLLADSDSDGLSDGWEAGFGRFSVVAGNYTWMQARTDARAKGGDLACFPIEARWNKAMETLGTAMDDFTGLWIGATDALTEGTWIWVNGEAFSLQQWATSRPSTATGNTLDYAEVAGGAGAEIGKWYDRTSSTTRDGYILETGYATSPTDADSDDDGLSDGTEVKITLTNPLVKDTDGNGTLDGDEDFDGDGFSNRQELELFLTAPNNGSDRFAIEFEYTASAHSLKFPTVSGRRYCVERSHGLANPAEWLETVTFIGNGAPVTVPLGVPFSSIWFYRVKVSLN